MSRPDDQVAAAVLPGEEPVVEVVSVSKSFGVRRRGLRGWDMATDGDGLAVDNVSFAVERKECVALVGESGSGKTTIARMVAGLETPSSGVILYDGVHDGQTTRLRRSLGRRRRIQMVYQDPYASLDPCETVERGISRLLRTLHSSQREGVDRRVSSLLSDVGLGDEYRAALPHDLSGGQRQRVAIARALACGPHLLILDEPVASLDVSVQGTILNLLTELLSRLPISFLFISHDLAVVRQVADRLVVLKSGIIVETGETDKVLSDPDSEYTQRLLASVPIPGWTPRRRGSPSEHVTGRD